MDVHTLMGDCGDGECSAYTWMKGRVKGECILWREIGGRILHIHCVGGCGKGDSILRWEIVKM